MSSRNRGIVGNLFKYGVQAGVYGAANTMLLSQSVIGTVTQTVWETIQPDWMGDMSITDVGLFAAAVLAIMMIWEMVARSNPRHEIDVVIVPITICLITAIMRCIGMVYFGNYDVQTGVIYAICMVIRLAFMYGRSIPCLQTQTRTNGFIVTEIYERNKAKLHIGDVIPCDVKDDKVIYYRHGYNKQGELTSIIFDAVALTQDETDAHKDFVYQFKNGSTDLTCPKLKPHNAMNVFVDYYKHSNGPRGKIAKRIIKNPYSSKVKSYIDMITHNNDDDVHVVAGGKSKQAVIPPRLRETLKNNASPITEGRHNSSIVSTFNKAIRERNFRKSSAQHTQSTGQSRPTRTTTESKQSNQSSSAPAQQSSMPRSSHQTINPNSQARFVQQLNTQQSTTSNTESKQNHPANQPQPIQTNAKSTQSKQSSSAPIFAQQSSRPASSQQNTNPNNQVHSVQLESKQNTHQPQSNQPSHATQQSPSTVPIQQITHQSQSATVPDAQQTNSGGLVDIASRAVNTVQSINNQQIQFIVIMLIVITMAMLCGHLSEYMDGHDEQGASTAICTPPTQLFENAMNIAGDLMTTMTNTVQAIVPVDQRHGIARSDVIKLFKTEFDSVDTTMECIPVDFDKPMNVVTWVHMYDEYSREDQDKIYAFLVEALLGKAQFTSNNFINFIPQIHTAISSVCSVVSNLTSQFFPGRISLEYIYKLASAIQGTNFHGVFDIPNYGARQTYTDIQALIKETALLLKSYGSHVIAGGFNDRSIGWRTALVGAPIVMAIVFFYIYLWIPFNAHFMSVQYSDYAAVTQYWLDSYTLCELVYPGNIMVDSATHANFQKAANEIADFGDRLFGLPVNTSTKCNYKSDIDPRTGLRRGFLNPDGLIRVDNGIASLWVGQFPFDIYTELALNKGLQFEFGKLIGAEGYVFESAQDVVKYINKLKSHTLLDTTLVTIMLLSIAAYTSHKLSLMCTMPDTSEPIRYKEAKFCKSDMYTVVDKHSNITKPAESSMDIMAMQTMMPHAIVKCASLFDNDIYKFTCPFPCTKHGELSLCNVTYYNMPKRNENRTAMYSVYNFKEYSDDESTHFN